MYRKIKAPDSLTSRTLTTNLQSVTIQILRQVTSLNQFVRECHTHYYSFAKELHKHSVLFENSIERATIGLTSTGLEFAKTMQILALNLQKQTNKNLVSLKTIKSEKDQSLCNVICDKLGKVENRLQRYESISRDLYQLEVKYLAKAEKFSDIDTDTVKFYSVAFFKRKFGKVTALQVDMQTQLEQLKTERLEIQFACQEIKKLYNDLLVTEIKKIRDIGKIAKLIIAKLIEFEVVIVEENSQDEKTVFSLQFRMPDERYMVDYCMDFFSRLSQSFATSHTVRECMTIYLANLSGLLNEHCIALAGLQRNSHYTSIDKGKQVIEAYLGKKIHEQFYQAYNEVFKYYNLLQKLISRIDRTKPLQEHIAIQKFNFDDYAKQFNQTLSLYMQARQQQSTPYDPQVITQLSERTFKELKMMTTKFTSKDQNLTMKFKEQYQRVLGGVKQVMKEYESDYQLVNKPTLVNEYQVLKVYQKRYFDMFINPFITNDGDYRFEHSKYIETYIKLRNQASNEPNNISVDVSEIASANSKYNVITKCFGGKGLNRKSIGDQQVIDEFNCALAYGILLQGKLYVHKRLLRFVSIFNRKTFFGKTELEIPKRDILKIEGENGAINYYVVITTKHGDVKFTSFINNPVSLLKEIYVEGRERLLVNRINSEKPTIIQYEIRQIHNRLMDVLTAEQFSNTGLDTYAKEFLHAENQCVCYVSVEATNDTLFLSFQYKFLSGPAMQSPERYFLKLTQSLANGKTTMHCQIDDGSSGQRTMKDHFLSITKKILQPYNNKQQLEEAKSLKHWSCALQLSTIDEGRNGLTIERPNGGSQPVEPVNPTLPFILNTSTTTLIPNSKDSIENRVTFNLKQSGFASNQHIIVKDRSQLKASQTPSTPISQLVYPPQNNFAMYIAMLVSLILLLLILS